MKTKTEVIEVFKGALEAELHNMYHAVFNQMRKEEVMKAKNKIEFMKELALDIDLFDSGDEWADFFEKVL